MNEQEIANAAKLFQENLPVFAGVDDVKIKIERKRKSGLKTYAKIINLVKITAHAKLSQKISRYKNQKPKKLGEKNSLSEGHDKRSSDEVWLEYCGEFRDQEDCHQNQIDSSAV